MNKNKALTIIRRIILVIAIAVFCFSAYKLIDIYLEYKKADDIYNNIEQDVLDTTPRTVVINSDNGDNEVEIPFTYNHEELLAINSEGIGYLYIPSIDLRLPIAQGTDNSFYLTHTFDKTYSGNGCIFEDYDISDGLDSSHIILYGHNMKNGSMFGQLSKYNALSFYQKKGNAVFYIYTKNRLMEYKIFSAYVSEPVGETYTYNFPSLESLRSYASTMKNYSLYDTGVDVSFASQVVTLSTCTADGSQRFIIQAVYVGQTQLDDN